MARLADKLDNLQPVLQAIGDDMVERTKRRFETSTAPDGTPWKPNAPATLDALAERLGKSYRRKNGNFNAAGQRRITGKKPLVGETQHLRRQIVAQATARDVTVSAGPEYAAIHQFGGKAGQGLKITIPARPYLPVRQDSTLYPQESELIVQALNDLLMNL